MTLEFENLTDLIQVFSNEWCRPKNNILINDHDKNYDFMKTLFEFINCETFFVTEYPDLPFEEKSFDIIIDFENQLSHFLKEDGIHLIKSKTGLFKLKDQYFCFKDQSL
jgi:hypothetical protein